jgi:hypothetical protein
LAVVAAIIAKEGWLTGAGQETSLWLDARQLDAPRYRAARLTPSRASYVPRGREYVVSISGGVDLDSWGVLQRVAVRPTLNTIRTSGLPRDAKLWWWD